MSDDILRFVAAELALERMTEGRDRVQVALEEADEATARESARADHAEEKCEAWRILAQRRYALMREFDDDNAKTLEAADALEALGVNPYEEP